MIGEKHVLQEKWLKPLFRSRRGWERVKQGIKGKTGDNGKTNSSGIGVTVTSLSGRGGRECSDAKNGTFFIFHSFYAFPQSNYQLNL